MSNDTQSQAAPAITGGTRAFRDCREGRTPLDGIYVARTTISSTDSTNTFRAQGETRHQRERIADRGPSSVARHDYAPTPERDRSRTDAGVAAVVDRWQVGLGVNGIANRITWKDATRTVYALDSLFNGGEFVDFPAVPVGDMEVELPVDVRANVAYNENLWTTIAEYGHGYNGTTFRAGYERRLKTSQLRGGARYIKGRWEPTGGVGFNLSPGFGIDVGFFSTSANLQKTRHLGIGVSLRLMRLGP